MANIKLGNDNYQEVERKPKDGDMLKILGVKQTFSQENKLAQFLTQTNRFPIYFLYVNDYMFDENLKDVEYLVLETSKEKSATEIKLEKELNEGTN